MTDEHREALLGPRPGTYAELGRFAREIQEKGSEGQRRLGLHEDIRIARGLVQELVRYADRRQNPDGLALPDTGEAEPLYEYVEGVQRPMSDATRMKLMGNLLPKVGKLIESEAKLRSATSISVEHMKVWFARLWSEVQALANLVDSGQLSSKEEVETEFKEIIRRVGDPRAMTG